MISNMKSLSLMVQVIAKVSFWHKTPRVKDRPKTRCPQIPLWGIRILLQLRMCTMNYFDGKVWAQRKAQVSLLT